MSQKNGKVPENQGRSWNWNMEYGWQRLIQINWEESVLECCMSVTARQYVSFMPLYYRLRWSVGFNCIARNICVKQINSGASDHLATQIFLGTLTSPL